MNPRVEAVLSVGLGSRPSLHHLVDKCEIGLEATNLPTSDVLGFCQRFTGVHFVN